MKQSSPNSQGPIVTADLLVCDLPDVEPLIRPETDAPTLERPPSATYAVSGTIVVRGADTDKKQPGGQLPELGDSTAPDVAAKGDPTLASGKLIDDAYPGPHDDGFWRQRDGKQEWHPTSGTPTENHATHGDANTASSGASPHASPHADKQDASHLSEYDAWSAEQEQGAFLSFNEWKEWHAQNAPGKANIPRRGTQRNEAKDMATKSRPAASDPETTSARGDDSHQQVTSDRHESSAPSPLGSRSSHPAPSQSQPDTAASKKTQTTPAQSHGEQDPNLMMEGSEPPVARQVDAEQIGFSVASGDTSTQLSKLKHRWNFCVPRLCGGRA